MILCTYFEQTLSTSLVFKFITAPQKYTVLPTYSIAYVWHNNNNIRSSSGLGSDIICYRQLKYARKIILQNIKFYQFRAVFLGKYINLRIYGGLYRREGAPIIYWRYIHILYNMMRLRDLCL